MATSASAREEREFEFSDNDFSRVRTLIYEHAGISLSPNKHDMVYSRLARRLRERKLIFNCSKAGMAMNGRRSLMH